MKEWKRKPPRWCNARNEIAGLRLRWGFRVIIVVDRNPLKRDERAGLVFLWDEIPLPEVLKNRETVAVGTMMVTVAILVFL